MAVEHKFAGVFDVDGRYQGHCTCGWTTEVLPKDDAWEALAQHILPFVQAAIGGLSGGSCRS